MSKINDAVIRVVERFFDAVWTERRMDVACAWAAVGGMLFLSLIVGVWITWAVVVTVT